MAPYRIRRFTFWIAFTAALVVGRLPRVLW